MPHEHRFSARLTWSGAAQGPTESYASYSREYTVEMDGKPTFRGSAAVPYRGDGSLPNPEDLLLASVSACHMLSYLALAANAGVRVVAYEDACDCIMRFHEGKMRIVEATLRPRVTLAPGSDAAKAESLHGPANASCFIANSVAFPIHHEPTTL